MGALEMMRLRPAADIVCIGKYTALVLRDTVGERHSPDALKPAELKLLSGTRWRSMVVPFALN